MSGAAEFAHVAVEDGLLVARADRLEDLRAARLDRRAGWTVRLAEAAEAAEAEAAGAAAAAGRTPPAGRGATAIVREAGEPALRLKALRRGGLLGPLWRDRFPGTARLLANLFVPAAARERGVPTPAAVALFLVPGPPGLWRGWLATENVAGARDLGAIVAETGPVRGARFDAALAAARIAHDAGVVHPDLNVGNLLVQDAPGGPRGLVLDLDRARLADGPLDRAARERALARLARSYRKHLARDAEDAAAFDRAAREAYAG